MACQRRHEAGPDGRSPGMRRPRLLPGRTRVRDVGAPACNGTGRRTVAMAMARLRTGSRPSHRIGSSARSRKGPACRPGRYAGAGLPEPGRPAPVGCTRGTPVVVERQPHRTWPAAKGRGAALAGGGDAGRRGPRYAGIGGMYCRPCPPAYKGPGGRPARPGGRHTYPAAAPPRRFQGAGLPPPTGAASQHRLALPPLPSALE